MRGSKVIGGKAGLLGEGAHAEECDAQRQHLFCFFGSGPTAMQGISKADVLQLNRMRNDIILRQTLNLVDRTALFKM